MIEPSAIAVFNNLMLMLFLIAIPFYLNMSYHLVQRLMTGGKLVVAPAYSLDMFKDQLWRVIVLNPIVFLAVFALYPMSDFELPLVLLRSLAVAFATVLLSCFKVVQHD
jgi:hypothetical protein